MKLKHKMAGWRGNRLLALLACGAFAGHFAMDLNSAPLVENRLLMIDPSSMPINVGKATLTIGVLQRTNGVYSGEYKMDVSPYFFKSEKGKLEIVVSDESLAKVGQGKMVAIVGTAISPDGKTRPIAAKATPTGSEGGRLKLWFTAGDRRMVFESVYRFGR